MPLPNEDPSNPALPAPLFADVDAVRGDQLRANDQLIWENFDYLNDGGNLNDAAAKNPPVDADTLPLSDSADSGVIKKLTFANLFLWIVTKVYALTGKTTPVDADQFLITDSAASNVGKSLTWANIKATLKTYFDTLYEPLTSAPATFTPTFTGFGTVSVFTAYGWRAQNNKVFYFEITFTSGTPSAAEARVSLPYTSASNYPTLQTCGSTEINSSSGVFHPVIEASKAYICLSRTIFGVTNGLNKSLGTDLVSAGAVVSISGYIRIA